MRLASQLQHTLPLSHRHRHRSHRRVILIGLLRTSLEKQRRYRHAAIGPAGHLAGAWPRSHSNTGWETRIAPSGVLQDPPRAVRVRVCRAAQRGTGPVGGGGGY